MTISAPYETGTRPQMPRWAVPALAGLATVAVATMAALAGPVGILIGWLGGSVACGLVLLVAGDERATRATLAMIVLLPAAVPLGSIALVPLWLVAGPWAAGIAQLVVTGLTPTVAMAVARRRPAVASAPSRPDAGSGSGPAWPCAPPRSSSPATSWSSSPPAPARSTVGSSSSCWPTWSRCASTSSACAGPKRSW